MSHKYCGSIRVTVTPSSNFINITKCTFKSNTAQTGVAIYFNAYLELFLNAHFITILQQMERAVISIIQKTLYTQMQQNIFLLKNENSYMMFKIQQNQCSILTGCCCRS